MKKKVKFEFKRKFIHLFSLLYVVVYLVAEKYYNSPVALFSLGGILLVFLIIEFIRIKLKVKIPIFHIFWRENEKDKLAGYIYFITGAIIAFAFFDKNIAIAAILMTTFGDMAAALIGINFGKHWLNKGAY